MINERKEFCYRISHIGNLPLLLKNGIVNRNHHTASNEYVEIGNSEIIDVRSSAPVKIEGYGSIGDYVPFYFTPKSIMLYNIITGYRHPFVQRRGRNEILIIRCRIKDLMSLPQWFFTDGQANDMASKHYNNSAHLKQIDWTCIQQSDFSKSDSDYDRPRRYQAEFLVRGAVPLTVVESLIVYNQHAAGLVTDLVQKNSINLAVNIQSQYFF